MATTSGKQPGRPQDPTTLSILPGSESLPRQIGIFPAFRAALLEDAARQPALASGWRGREVQELGVMLFEMWAYICDVLSFYDQFNANESYLRTALRVAATRRLIHLLGYVPRPAVAASADLALTLSGRLPVTVPQGAAFRSGAFTGSDGTEEKPQVFTALNAAAVHPFVDKFSLSAQPAATFGTGVGNTSITKIYLKPQGATLLEGDAFLIRGATDAQTYAAMADTIEPITGEEGTDLIEVTLKRAISLPATLNFAGVRVERATQTAKLFNLTSISGNPAIFTASGSTLRVLLSSLNETIKIGDRIIFSYALPNTTPLWYTVTGVASKSVNFSPAVTVTVETDDGDSSITTPALKMPVTELSINLGYTPDVFAMALINAAAPWITVHHAIVKAGTATGTTRTTIGAGDVLKVNEKVEMPPDEYEPTNFIVKDYDERAVSVTGSLKADGTLDVDPASAWTGELKPPLTLYGALVRVTRGEQVTGELLGVGDGSTPNQQFKLKKKPLTYVNAPSSANASGVASTLEVYVDNVRWSEAPVFYGADSDDPIYTVRQNEDGDSLITFGDGERGARLTAGARVTANYVFGAGAAAPPASSITQPVKAIKGVVAATNPLPAFGGADEEDDALIKQYAPRSALMLGRAVSLVDYEAVAAATSGVRVAAVDWGWSETQQRPVVQVWYIPTTENEGVNTLGSLIRDRLEAVSAVGVPFEVMAATKKARTITVGILVESDYAVDPVVADTQAALEAALLPEALGIGATLFRSKVLAVAGAVEGVAAPLDVFIGSKLMEKAGIKAGAGKYFEFTVVISAKVEQANRAKGGAVVGDIAP